MLTLLVASALTVAAPWDDHLAQPATAVPLAGDATPLGTTCLGNFYAYYGPTTIDRMATEFVARLRDADPEAVGTSLRAAFWRHGRVDGRARRLLLAWWTEAMGGGEAYSGPPLDEALGPMRLTRVQVTAIVETLVLPAMAAAGVAEQDLEGCVRPLLTDERMARSFVVD